MLAVFILCIILISGPLPLRAQDAAEAKKIGAEAETKTKSLAEIQWKAISPGLEYASLEYSGMLSFRLQLFRVDLAHLDIFAADARSYGDGRMTATVKEMAQREKALLAVNGSFFDEKQRPLGMVISRGERINPFRRADWGVLYIIKKQARLIHTRNWEKDPVRDVDFALQVGPRIVVKGKPTRLKPQVARRAAIGILPGGGKLIFAVTESGRAFAEDLAQLMAKPTAQGGLGCSEAVLMDGGPSAQLYAKVGPFELDISGGWPVPIGVLVLEKGKGSIPTP